MIYRVWTAETNEAKADDYRRYFSETVLPGLKAIDGFKGVTLLERREGDVVEFIVTTRWDNLDAIRAFAGHHHEHAVVEEPARAALDRFDSKVKHYVLALEENR